VSYRPITDTWILARSKTKYYGAYPAGFLHRARALLGVSKKDPVLHICAGKVREYPYRGLGVNDMTLDLDPATDPDFLRDARETLPTNHGAGCTCKPVCQTVGFRPCPPDTVGELWAAVLIDRPYTEDDAEHYVPGAAALPDLNPLLKRAIQIVPEEGRVGVLDYMWPHPGKLGREVAVVGVGTGRNGRARWFTVFERLSATEEKVAA
jgi:hypothetical protein